MKKLFLVTLGLLLLGACATTTPEIESEKGMVKGVHSREAMIERTRSILANAEGLSESQRDEFVSLHSKILSDVMDINSEIRKTKVVLMQNMVAPQYDAKKVKVISRNLEKLYGKKLSVMMEGFDKGREILGVAAPNVLKDAWVPHEVDALY